MNFWNNKLEYLFNLESIRKYHRASESEAIDTPK